MDWECYKILNGGEGGRGEHVTVMLQSSDRRLVAEYAAEYFDDVEQMRERCGNDPFDGTTQFIEVIDSDYQKSTRHEVMCEVKRSYISVVR